MRFFKNKKGQSLIEVGLTIPILMLVVIGTVDIFKILICYVNMESALRIGISEASKSSGASGGVQRGLTTAEREYRDYRFFKGDSKNVLKVKISPKTPNGKKTGNLICYDGQVDVDIIYGKFFNENGSTTIPLKKTVCTINERG